jgi:stringent starvation protein B
MTSTKPYLIRAFYEWILDNQQTPYIAVNADIAGTIVPMQYVEAGKITLNIAPSAVKSLTLGNDQIHFNARFSGVLTKVVVPIRGVLAIYARENGRGMVFSEEEGGDDSPPPTPSKASRPKLTVVK